MKSLRRRKRPPCSQAALDWPFSGSSVVIHEPSLIDIPPIVTLTPATTTPVAQVKLFIEDLPSFSQKNLHQDSVTVDQFIRQVTAKVPGPYHERKFLIRELKNVHTSSPGSAFIARPAARTKLFSRNQGRVSKTPIRDRKPMTLTQRLTRAAILSHVKTDNILHSTAISPPLPPLDFVPFQKFATPPSSKKRSAPSRGESHPESSVAPRRRKRYQKLNPISRQPGSDRSRCLPLTFIPFLEAEDAYAAKFS